MVIKPDVIHSQNPIDEDTVDIPLVSNLDAPLKATLDITDLNKQLRNLVEKKVKAGVEEALTILVKGTIDKRFNKAKDEITSWNNGQLTELQKDVESLKNQLIPVAFFAYRSSDLPTKSKIRHTVILYDTVDLNLGNGYNKNTGKFTAPSDGLYLFHVSTGVFNRSWSVVDLVLNGVTKDIGWPDSGDHEDRNQVTTATPLSLKKGDVVWARIGDTNGGNYIESNQYIRTSFSCIKIA